MEIKMFDFLKFGKPKAVSAADFDVIEGLKAHDVTLTDNEIVSLYLDWTQNPNTMTRAVLGRLVADKCEGFKARFAGKSIADRDVMGGIFAKDVIAAMKRMKLIVAGGRKSSAEFAISKRGEQIRQFYVLSKGLRGSMYDRMDRFAAA
jgi:hypothetical protein